MAQDTQRHSALHPSHLGVFLQELLLFGDVDLCGRARPLWRMDPLQHFVHNCLTHIHAHNLFEPWLFMHTEEKQTHTQKNQFTILGGQALMNDWMDDRKKRQSGLNLYKQPFVRSLILVQRHATQRQLHGGALHQQWVGFELPQFRLNAGLLWLECELYSLPLTREDHTLEESRIGLKRHRSHI